MDARNYSIGKKAKRINPNSKSKYAQDVDPDFDIELMDDSNGNPQYIKVSKCLKDRSFLDGKFKKVSYVDNDENNLSLNDLVDPSLEDAKVFTFVFNLNDFHIYKYDVKLLKNNKLTYDRLVKIICNSVKDVLEEADQFMDGAEDRAARKQQRSELKKKYQEEMQNGGEFDVLDKLNRLEVDTIGVKLPEDDDFDEKPKKKKDNVPIIFVKFTGFDDFEVDPLATFK